MPKIPLLAWIFQAIPEGIVLASLVICMATGYFPWKRIFKVGLAYAVCIYLIRFLPFTPGVHVVVLAAILGVLSIFLGELEMKRALTYSAIAMAMLVLAEFVAMYTAMSLNITSFEQLNQNIYLRILFGYPHTILLFLIAWVLVKKNITLNFLFRDKADYFSSEENE